MAFDDEDDYLDRRFGGGPTDGYRRYTPHHAYRKVGPFRFITIVMTALMVCILAIGIVCAVMVAADFAEEYSSRAKLILRSFIILNFIVHISIAVVDDMRWWCSAISLVANVLYVALIRRFPVIPRLSHPLVWGTLITVLAESFAWYIQSQELAYYTSFTAICAFFTLLWLVPIGLLACCISEEDQLPGASNVYRGGLSRSDVGHGTSSPAAGPRKKRSIFQRFVSLLGRE